MMYSVINILDKVIGFKTAQALCAVRSNKAKKTSI